MISLYINNTWKKAHYIHVFKQGAWKNIKSMHRYNQTGTLTRLFASVVDVVIESPQIDFNLKDHLSQIPDDLSTLYIKVMVNAPLSASSTSTHAFSTEGLPQNAEIILINKSEIIGAGGNGGAVNNPTDESIPDYPLYRGTDGAPGGNAIFLSVPTEILNFGLIAGGGGGGAASAYDFEVGGNSGGGGAGSTPGNPGGFLFTPTGSHLAPTQGSAGTRTLGGMAGQFDIDARANDIAIYSTPRGGAGGNLGCDGESSTNRFDRAGIPRFAASGGKAGRAIIGASFIKRFIGNTSTHVLGEVL